MTSLMRPDTVQLSLPGPGRLSLGHGGKVLAGSAYEARSSRALSLVAFQVAVMDLSSLQPLVTSPPFQNLCCEFAHGSRGGLRYSQTL